MDLSLDDIQQLSPDDASIKAAKGLVIPAKWPLLAVNDAALWGECQGSGSKPYQVQVDKIGPAFKCSCPSRKFPCKHGLALLLLHNQHSDKFSSAAEPGWVSDWLKSRHEKAEKQTAKKAEAAAAPIDPAASAKREQARAQRMLNGLDELELWLKDQIRQGLAQLSSQPNLGQQLATRMVDAQLPGIANRLRLWPSIIASNNQWPEKILAEFGELQLLIDSFRRIHNLPENVQADLRTALGVPIDKEMVLSKGEKITDDWLVLGQYIFEEDRLWVRRVWLRAKNSSRIAFLLDFSHGTRQFEHFLINGTCVKMTLAFYTGNRSQRALVVDKPQPLHSTFTLDTNLSQSLQKIADQLSANPWQWPQALTINKAIIVIANEDWYLITDDGQQLSLKINTQEAWQLLAESGGIPLTFFGEWQDNQLRLLSAWREQIIWSGANL